ncbi:tryptophan synthase subunit alpha [Acidaminobacter hydrogenoformans]|uniref:Tryptophan synthase alpha chain n=1 Tax=Acidaminobacter hydrogenoformans DSM 2784 TaxID=1120920 RepID=A0A1G5RR59_9FIRM|nr:tryptophan synthase subunit alpha [Acidaminobacter hydrogenoformans]SCZ76563.1 tryptophan synthase, alpha chain [Acidaminobacter hydrogenoformans DSM 2784]
MNRIDATFEALRGRGEKALIAFVTAGDPDMGTTEALVKEMVARGADLVELGVPFSDPMAEGPIIQAASARALEAGATLPGIFDLVARLRGGTVAKTPLLLMMYLNCILHYGKDRFFEACARVGIDGVIVPDLPYGEQVEISGEARAHGVHLISLVAPTSRDRIDAIAENSEGFLYCVSSLGVTGTRAAFATDFDAFFGEIRKHAKIPTAVGFGISSPAQAKALAGYADGVIVGSAVVDIVAQHGTDAVAPVGTFIEALKDAIRG